MSLLRGAVGLTSAAITVAAMRFGSIEPTYYAQVLWFQSIFVRFRNDRS